MSQIQLKREHWEEVIDSLNFALSGQGCRKDGHGLGKNARAFFNYCSVLPKRDHKYRDWNDLTWSFDEANVADIQNVKIWQRGYQKRRREEKRMEEGGSVSDVDDKCVAKVREEPPEEAKKPKARAPKAASEAAKVAPAMPSREDVSACTPWRPYSPPRSPKVGPAPSDTRRDRGSHSPGPRARATKYSTSAPRTRRSKIWTGASLTVIL